MNARTRIQWKRVLLYGLAAEFLVILVALAVMQLAGTLTGQYSTTVLSFLGTFIFGWLAARKVGSGQELHGLLVGVTAVAVYFALGLVATLAGAPAADPPPPYVYELAHVLKVLGGVTGGLAAARRRIAPLHS